MSSVRFVELADTTEKMLEEAFGALEDHWQTPNRPIALNNREQLLSAMLERREKMLENELPASLYVMQDGDKNIGWCGWVPYVEAKDSWQTSTYIATPWRGTGLFERARCRQMHDMGLVVKWAETRGGRVESFVSSIACWNDRSLRASRRYATSNRWPDTWKRIEERESGRQAYVFFYPQPVPDHQCFLEKSAQLGEPNP